MQPISTFHFTCGQIERVMEKPGRTNKSWRGLSSNGRQVLYNCEKLWMIYSQCWRRLVLVTSIDREETGARLKPGWRMVHFGDVVSNVDINERDPLASGLEHLDPASLDRKSTRL